jgi:hypothetical protein
MASPARTAGSSLLAHNSRHRGKHSPRAKDSMGRPSRFATRQSQTNTMNIFVVAMPFCLMVVNGFSVGGIRSAPATQTRKFRVAASSRPSTADPTFLESIPKSKRTAEENDKVEEDAVDEYLEFLDRRYRYDPLPDILHAVPITDDSDLCIADKMALSPLFSYGNSGDYTRKKQAAPPLR